MSRGGARPGAGRKRKEYSYQPSVKQSTPLVPTTERDAFTAEQMEQLKASPHVRKVTSKTVSYTVEFKEHFWRQYNDGVMPVKIFEDAGFDVNLIGDARIYGLLTTLRRTKERGVPFADGREPRQAAPKEETELDSLPKPPRMPPFKKLDVGTMDETEVRRLMHQVAFLTQEMEFLKKIISLANGGKSK